ncbi:MAG TPA: [protein-PII] uridylyltransferase, partial [Polyangiaceae bacterium]
PLWDAGLSIGHQVVTPGEMIDLARSDLPTATSLLDWRLIAGESSGTEKMLSRVYNGVFGSDQVRKFLRQLEMRAAERSERYGGSVYLLEPDVKNGIGGLRDLDIMYWVARARWRAPDLTELVKVGILVPREHQKIEAAAALLWRVRNLLHAYAGRRSDRLSFERQEAFASDLGYGNGGLAVERFMSEYYRCAQVLVQGREMLLGRAAPPPKRRPRETLIGGGLKLTNGLVSLVDPADLEKDPALSLRLYDEAVRRNTSVYQFARDAVARIAGTAEFCERLRASPQAARLFVRLITVAQRTEFKEGSVLRELHDVGLLVAMLPEFTPVVGRVHHDVYHVYTVDVHSVKAVDRLRALCRGELAAEHPLASRLAAELPGRNVLFFATLLHDVGKDIGGKKHSERGAELAVEILGRLGFSDSDIGEVRDLVLNHLSMYLVATRRDIDDPKTLEAFCNTLHGAESLRELYLLTIADVSTTSPTALSSWKARMLEDLYVAAERYLSKGKEAAFHQRAEGVRHQVRQLCPERGEAEFLDHYLSAIPERYLYANQPDDIVRHSRFARQAQFQAVNITVMTRDDPYVELCFVADDRPGLLAMITATLAAARIKVVRAQIYSWTDTYRRVRALDLFWVRSGTSERGVMELLPRLERDFGRLMSHELTPVELVAGPRNARTSDRPTPEVPTEIQFDNRSSTDHSVIEIITRDQVGLLFWLSNTLQHCGLTISFAKINTEGTQVADVFYVTQAAGGKITDPRAIETIKQQLLSTIARTGQTP